MPDFDVDRALETTPDIKGWDALPPEAQEALRRIVRVVEASWGTLKRAEVRECARHASESWAFRVFLYYAVLPWRQGAGLEEQFDRMAVAMEEASRPAVIHSVGFNAGQLSFYCAGI